MRKDKARRRRNGVVTWAAWAGPEREYAGGRTCCMKWAIRGRLEGNVILGWILCSIRVRVLSVVVLFLLLFLLLLLSFLHISLLTYTFTDFYSYYNHYHHFFLLPLLHMKTKT